MRSALTVAVMIVAAHSKEIAAWIDSRDFEDYSEAIDAAIAASQR